ncbi:MAG: hypothetical protein NUW01_14235 [Gemmatimonadaceae bacterium]|nr:hypothetical protein [Gemmatimonadaceae bacterium]
MRQELLAAGIPESALGNSAAILAAWQSVANAGDRVTPADWTTPPASAYDRSQGRPPAAGVSEQNPNLVGGGTGSDSGRTPGTMPGEGAGQSGGTPSQRAIVGADGNVYNVVMSDAEYAQAQADINQIQADARKAQEFQQGIQSGQLDIARATQAAAAAYQQALIDGKNRELAIQEAQLAMQKDFQEQQLQLSRMIAAANIRNQRDATDLQRRQLRARRVAAVRFV